jgi:LysM repeat protein
MNMQTEEESEIDPSLPKRTGVFNAFLSSPIHRLKKILKNNLSPKIYFNLGLLLVISLMPWVSEVTVNKQVYADIMKFSDPLNPIKAGELTERISPFTPGLQENPEDVVISMMIASDNYTLAQQLALNADKDLNAPDRQEATYIVKGGETITQIAEKFNLHVQSILDANNIKPEDTNKIREGYVLNIPSSDTSTSNDWLVAIKKAEEDAKARAAAEATKKRLATSKALAATNRKTSSGYGSVDNSGIITPISGRGISQYFGRGHTGVDYMANVGTPVMAAASGKVVIISSGWSGGYGNQIVIDHGGGRATRYAHLSRFNVSSGETVSKGQIVAYSGNTGRSTGPHLHFELIIGGRPVNPL